MKTLIPDNDSHTLPDFREDVLKGLTSTPKYLLPKYFYDAIGDKLFQQIMALPEYYLTDAELEIFTSRCDEILEFLKDLKDGFDLIELGSGDALKSSQLMKCLSQAGIDFTYRPIDISRDVLEHVKETLPQTIEGIKIEYIQGEYFEGLKQIPVTPQKPKLLLFLGGNIGNMFPEEAEAFLKKLHQNLNTGDFLLIGFDLKKNPWTIFNAYNDSQGITKEFNLNLLKRINRELDADFNPSLFEHYESYDPETGACKSYLISLAEQTIRVANQLITFEENEHIFMETSHKYSLKEVDAMAKKTGFSLIKHLFDSNKWFTDVIWRRD